ncbi:uncharacterized protein LOC110976861 [Acanthaster planci]|uniref:Uncharacterized protein LOC110976861 n=1 Tax=Acanthaster planci TaxID=133434 RepID=A0A8B7XZ65_ACAPL|nr:uncharacterized protein LOC110976861 [Acanthaster planci]
MPNKKKGKPSGDSETGGGWTSVKRRAHHHASHKGATAGGDGRCIATEDADSSEEARTKELRYLQEMFSGKLDPVVVHMIMNDCDFKVETALETLFELAEQTSPVESQMYRLSGFKDVYIPRVDAEEEPDEDDEHGEGEDVDVEDPPFPDNYGVRRSPSTLPRSGGDDDPAQSPPRNPGLSTQAEGAKDEGGKMSSSKADSLSDLPLKWGGLEPSRAFQPRFPPKQNPFARHPRERPISPLNNLSKIDPSDSTLCYTDKEASGQRNISEFGHGSATESLITNTSSHKMNIHEVRDTGAGTCSTLSDESKNDEKFAHKGAFTSQHGPTDALLLSDNLETDRIEPAVAASQTPMSVEQNFGRDPTPSSEEKLKDESPAEEAVSGSSPADLPAGELEALLGEIEMCPEKLSESEENVEPSITDHQLGLANEASVDCTDLLEKTSSPAELKPETNFSQIDKANEVPTIKYVKPKHQSTTVQKDDASKNDKQRSMNVAAPAFVPRVYARPLTPTGHQQYPPPKGFKPRQGLWMPKVPHPAGRASSLQKHLKQFDGQVGRPFFTPSPGSREQSPNLLEESERQGWNASQQQQPFQHPAQMFQPPESRFRPVSKRQPQASFWLQNQPPHPRHRMPSGPNQSYQLFGPGVVPPSHDAPLVGTTPSRGQRTNSPHEGARQPQGPSQRPVNKHMSHAPREQGYNCKKAGMEGKAVPLPEGKVLCLMRGCPGSGKSTLARTLVGNGQILSTDDYFTREDGQYCFDITKLSEAHDWSHQRAKEAMESGVTPLVIDNTNIERWTMKPYVAMAVRYGYAVEFREPTTPWKFNLGKLFKYNSHGVPRERIKLMIERFERDVNVENILGSSKPEKPKRKMTEAEQHPSKESWRKTKKKGTTAHKEDSTSKQDLAPGSHKAKAQDKDDTAADKNQEECDDVTVATDAITEKSQNRAELFMSEDEDGFDALMDSVACDSAEDVIARCDEDKMNKKPQENVGDEMMVSLNKESSCETVATAAAKSCDEKVNDSRMVDAEEELEMTMRTSEAPLELLEPFIIEGTVHQVLSDSTGDGENEEDDDFLTMVNAMKEASCHLPLAVISSLEESENLQGEQQEQQPTSSPGFLAARTKCDSHAMLSHPPGFELLSKLPDESPEGKQGSYSADSDEDDFAVMMNLIADASCQEQDQPVPICRNEARNDENVPNLHCIPSVSTNEPSAFTQHLKTNADLHNADAAGEFADSPFEKQGSVKTGEDNGGKGKADECCSDTKEANKVGQVSAAIANENVSLEKDALKRKSETDQVVVSTDDQQSNHMLNDNCGSGMSDFKPPIASDLRALSSVKENKTHVQTDEVPSTTQPTSPSDLLVPSSECRGLSPSLLGPSAASEDGVTKQCQERRKVRRSRSLNKNTKMAAVFPTLSPGSENWSDLAGLVDLGSEDKAGLSRNKSPVLESISFTEAGTETLPSDFSCVQRMESGELTVEDLRLQGLFVAVAQARQIALRESDVTSQREDAISERPLSSSSTSHSPVPATVRLHKSTMTDHEESTENINDNLKNLITLFPAVSPKDLEDILARCKGDLEWATNILLDDFGNRERIDPESQELNTSDQLSGRSQTENSSRPVKAEFNDKESQVNGDNQTKVAADCMKDHLEAKQVSQAENLATNMISVVDDILKAIGSKDTLASVDNTPLKQTSERGKTEIDAVDNSNHFKCVLESNSSPVSQVNLNSSNLESASSCPDSDTKVKSDISPPSQEPASNQSSSESEGAPRMANFLQKQKQTVSDSCLPGEEPKLDREDLSLRIGMSHGVDLSEVEVAAWIREARTESNILGSSTSHEASIYPSTGDQQQVGLVDCSNSASALPGMAYSRGSGLTASDPFTDYGTPTRENKPQVVRPKTPLRTALSQSPTKASKVKKPKDVDLFVKTTHSVEAEAPLRSCELEAAGGVRFSWNSGREIEEFGVPHEGQMMTGQHDGFEMEEGSLVTEEQEDATLHDQPVQKKLWELRSLEEGLILQLPPAFALQLQEMFGSIGFHLLPELLPAEDLQVHVDYDLAKTLHTLWAQTLQTRFDKEEELDSIIQADEELARKLQQEEDIQHMTEVQSARSAKYQGTKAPLKAAKPPISLRHGYGDSKGMMGALTTTRQPPAMEEVKGLKEIMEEELAAQLSKDMEVESKLKTDDSVSIATKLKRDKLFSEFPTLDRDVLEEIFRDYNYQLDPTIRHIKSFFNTASSQPKNVYTDEALERIEKELIGVAERQSLASSEDTDESNPQEAFQSTENPDYQDYRGEATMHYRLRHEAFQKAAAAYNRGQKELASFYSQQGHLHTEKLKAANKRASEAILSSKNALFNDNTLDLHGLHVDEALLILKQVLSDKEAELAAHDQLPRPSKSPQKYIFVITGKGNRSRGGVARIRPAVTELLKQEGYRFSMPNAGLIKVVL